MIASDEDDAGGSPRTRHRALYREIPTLRCVAGCSDCCGPAPVSPWEAERLGIAGAVTTPVHPGTSRCRFLVGGACSVYVKRPFACRLFGTTPIAPCGRGARPNPAAELSTARAIALTRRFEAGCPSSWHEARRRAVRTVVERDGSPAERHALVEHRTHLADLRRTLELDER